MSTEWIFICSHYNKLVKDSDPWHWRNLPSFDIFNKIIPKRAGKKKKKQLSLSLFLSIKWDTICIMKKNTNNLIVFWSSFYKAFAWDLILPSKSIRFARLCWRQKSAALNVSSWLGQAATHASAETRLKAMCSRLLQPAQARGRDVERSYLQHCGVGGTHLCSRNRLESRECVPWAEMMTEDLCFSGPDGRKASRCLPLSQLDTNTGAQCKSITSGKKKNQAAVCNNK